MQNFEEIKTDKVSQPQGAYSQAILASGPFLFISGQTPRLANGILMSKSSIEEQTKIVLENIQEIARAAGMELENSVHLTIYLSNLDLKAGFEKVYQTFFKDKLPARIVVQSSFTSFDIEISAILQK